MLDAGLSIAEYRIVAPLAENPLYQTYQVSGAGADAARLLLIAPDQLQDKTKRRVFLEQARRLLQHSFAGHANLLAAAATDEYQYCVYPFLPGSPLAECLDEPISVRRAVEIVQAVAELLNSSHKEGFWHGNIAPDTIFLDGDRVALDQFALASLLRLDFNSGVDAHYCSPELVRGEELGSAADLYSLGIVLYRLLTGTLPFTAAEPFAAAMQHVQGQPVLLPPALADLQPMLDGLLKAVPTERWSAQRLIEETEHLLQSAELDSLTIIAQPPEEQILDATGEPTDLERGGGQLPGETELVQRIEQRLQQQLTRQRKDTEQGKVPDSGESIEAERQFQPQPEQMNRYYRDSGKNPLVRLLMLFVVGVIVGVAIYTLIWGVPQPKAAAVVPDELLTILEAGSRQLQQGNLAQAEQIFSDVLERYPQYPQPYNNLATVYAWQGDLDRSRDLLEQAMATDQSYATVYRNLGTVYAEMARVSYGRALQLNKTEQPVTLEVFGGSELVAVNSVPQEVEQLSDTGSATTVAEADNQVALAAVDSQTAEPVLQDSGSQAEAEAASTVVGQEMTAVDEPAQDSAPIAQQETVEQFLQRWAAAWSAKDVSDYLSFYAEEFVPSSGISRQAWNEQRNSRLTRPEWIEVGLEDFEIIEPGDMRQQVEVTQNYRSDRYSDRTRKVFELSKTGDSWQIVRERSLGRIR